MVPKNLDIYIMTKDGINKISIEMLNNIYRYFSTMKNQRLLVIVSISLIISFGLSQTSNYGWSSQIGNSVNNNKNISISDTPFYKSINGTVIGEKVIDIHSADDRRVEVSFVENAIMDGIGNVTNIGTYSEHMLSSNVMRGTGEGIITGVNGSGTIGWSAFDLGNKDDNGNFIFKGITFFHILDNDDGDKINNVFNSFDNQVGVYKNVVNFANTDEYVGREMWKLN